MTKTTYKEIVLESSFDEVEHLEDYVNELQDWADFNDEDYARIMLTLSEAVTNAIVHGNKENPEKQVTIRSELTDGTLSISVKDEGAGFDPSNIPDPLKEENLLNIGGRGVYLIKQYADDLQFNENGTKLEMLFKLN
ncbi:MAG TPA: ATP-binding protein [Halalkalibaculum sp.]|nr:ATP-binding protein [Halalkalibaculum sp.]